MLLTYQTIFNKLYTKKTIGSNGQRMRGMKIFLFTAAVIFVNSLLFLQCFQAFSKWTLKTSRFKLKRIYNAPIQRIKSFRLPRSQSDSLFGIKDTEPGYDRLYFFSPFHKTQVGVSVILDMVTPRLWDHTTFQVIDDYNNGEPVFPLFGIEKGKFIFELRDLKGKTTYRKTLENLSLPIPTDLMELGIVTLEDIDADGGKDFVWRISGRFVEGLPRGIAVHDILTGKKKWDFLFGGLPFMTIVKDINNDGKKECIFSTAAPHNGFSWNGMDDDTSYVGELDYQGKLLWLYEAGGFYSKANLAVEDLDRNGTYEVITALSCHRDNDPDPGRVRVYDAVTGKILNTADYPGLSFTSLFVTEMDNDPNLEIISSDTRGSLRIWDNKLNTISEFKGDSDIRIIGVEKVYEHSSPFIFTWYAYNTLLVFDNRLRIIFNLKFPKDLTNPYTEPVIRVSNGKEHFIVLIADHTYMISMKQGFALQDYLLLFRSPFSFYLLGIFVFNGFLFIVRGQRKKIRERYLQLVQKEPGSNLQWTASAQEALHKMKSPLTAILWETEKIDALLEKKRQSKTFWSKLKEINDAILSDINELKLMNHFLMRFLQVQTLHLREIDIKAIITTLLDKYQSSFGNKFTFVFNCSDPLPSLLADEERLKEVFSIIIDNAVDAAAEGGTISISAVHYKILPAKNKKNILCIEIEDSGCGISPDKVGKIFEPYYTTKTEGTGIGLAITRRIVESHDGWIEVESRLKIGTKFALYFPVKNLTY